MSRLSQEHAPVLLLPDQVDQVSLGRIPLSALDAYTDRDPALPDGVVAAAELLLSRSGVAVYFVDATAPHAPRYEGDLTVPVTALLGFNDHGGGSESDFRVSVRRPDEQDVLQPYLLISPPDSEGNPTNMTFHYASYRRPDKPPEAWEIASSDVPNPSKMAGVSQAQGFGPRYDHYLVGNPDTPGALGEALERAGFEFDDWHYGSGGMPFNRRAHAVRAASRAAGELVVPWPNGQFEPHIAAMKSQLPK